MITEQFKQYLAGFIDGDGSIYIAKQKTGYVVTVTLSQSNEDFIDKVRVYYPEFIKQSRTDKVLPTHRAEYRLIASGDRVWSLLSDIEKYAILKHDQVIHALKFLSLDNREKEAKEYIFNYMRKTKAVHNKTNLPLDRFNEIYMAGLFDAEGCIRSSCDSIKITQKSSELILKKIADFYNVPVLIDNYALVIYKKNVIASVLNSIKPYSIYKLPQINVYLDDEIPLSEKRLVLKEMKREDHSSKASKNEDIIYMREIIQNLQKYDYQELINMRKYEQLLGIQESSLLNKKVFYVNNYNDFCIEPVLEFAEKTDKLHKFNYYLSKTSSVAYNNRPGRNIKILVKDNITQTYIGLIQMSDPVIRMGKRDEYIPEEYIQNSMDITVCVPLQPFGFNTNGGKLIAMLCFSKEIADYYKLKFKRELKYIYTTSLYGKSIMYERLKCLKYIGNTDGYGVLHIPPLVINTLYEINARHKLIQLNKRNNLYFMSAICQYLKEKDITFHGHPKGIYIGNKPIGMQSLSEIYQEWFNTYAIKRIKNLIKNCRIETKTPENIMYSAETFPCKKLYHLPRTNNNLELFKSILKYKNTEHTYKDLEHILMTKEKIQISSTRIQQIFQGKVRPNEEDEEYTELLRQIKPVKRRLKYTEEEIKFIQKHLHNKEDRAIQELFSIKFNKIIPCSTIKTYRIKKQDIPIDLPTFSIEEAQLSHPDTHIMHIMRMKKDPCTLQEIRKKLRETHNIRIGTVLLNKIWNGEYKQIDTPEFQELLKYQRKKRYYQSKSECTKKKMSESIKQAVAFRKILTDSEEREIAEALKDNTGFPTQASVCKYFTEKFGKPVKRHIVYAIQKKLETQS